MLPLLAGLCLGAKVARDAGAPPWLLTLALIVTAGVAVALVVTRRGRWLDAGRLALVLVGLWTLPDVYAGIGGDGYEYYALLRSPLLDHDLDFANDFAGLGARPVLSSEGDVTSRTPIGMAVLWLPGFALAHLAAVVVSALGGPPADGFWALYRSAVTATTYALAFAALLLIEAALRRRHGAGVAVLSAFGLWLATPLHFYMVANPSMSHGGSAFAATCFVVAWLRAREADTPRAWAVAGLLGGLTALVRSQDAVLLLPALLDLSWRPAPRARRIAAFLAGPAVLGGVQAGVWLALYGARFVSVVTTQNWVGGGGWHALDVLFAARHGLLTWTPLYWLAVAGWLVAWRREARLFALVLLGFALAVSVNGLMLDWWGSHAFGQRRLLSLTPLFALGLGAALDLARRRPLLAPCGVLAALALWNLQFEYIYNSEMLAAKGEAVSLDRLAGAQAGVLYRRLLRLEPELPAPVFAYAYDNLKGVWLDEGPRSLRGRLELGDERPDLPEAVGHNWYAPEEQDGVGFRRSRDRRSWLRLPIRSRGDFALTLRARSELGAIPLGLRVEANGEPLGECALSPEWRECRLDWPRGAVKTGFNDLALLYSTTPREAIPGYHGKNAAIALDWIRCERREAR